MTPPPQSIEYKSTETVNGSGNTVDHGQDQQANPDALPKVDTRPDKADDPNPQPKPNASVSVDEAATPPNQVMGSYLRCFIQNAMKRVELDDVSQSSPESCRFEGSGLVWTRDNGASYRQSDAQIVCENLDDNTHDWRLPTLGEMQGAFHRQIDVLNSAHFLKLKTSFYWTSSMADPSDDGEGDQFASFNLFTGLGKLRNSDEQLSVLCVRAMNQDDERDSGVF